MLHSTEKRRQKETLYQLFARIGQALSSPRRLELLDLLAQAPRTVEELAQEASMSVANTSQHLQHLKRARLVKDERMGNYIRYELADESVARLWLELRTVGEGRLAEVKNALAAYRSHQHEFEQVSAQALRERLQSGEVILLDVRPRVEYEAGHLPSAVSMPLDELEERLNELPKEMPVVAYCRGPYCVFADEALALLSERGWQVARLEEGVVEWKRAGHPVG